jgi:hypothetical protein
LTKEPLDDVSLRRLRVAAQLLGARRRRQPVELVRHLAGMQAQVLSAASLGLRARASGLTVADVDAARLRERSIVLAWAMRGTLHLIAAADYGWLVPLVTEPRVGNSLRRLNQEGVPADVALRAVQRIERMLEREGPLTRSEIAERLRRLSVPAQGQAMAHLIWLAAARGVACHGPMRDGNQCFVLVRDWLGEPKPRDREASLAELAHRYLIAHAPAGPNDLAAWAGIGRADAARAWASVGQKLTPLETARGPMWSLAARQAPGPQPGPVRLLPSFDEYLLGWRERSFAVPVENQREVNRGGGWLQPVVLADGEVVGTWRGSHGRRFEISLRAFKPLPAQLQRGIAAEADEIRRFLGTSDLGRAVYGA